MVEFTLNTMDFPSLQGRKSVFWAPVFLSPIMGSPERLVVAIVVAGEHDGVVCPASGLDRIQCFYGKASELILAATRVALHELEVQISKHGQSILTGGTFCSGPIQTGAPIQSTATDMRSLARMWLDSISSLHNSSSVVEFRAAVPLEALQVKDKRARGDRLRSEVLKVATDRKSPILQYFTKATRLAKTRMPLANVSLDYQGKRVVANFSKLRPMANMRAEFDRIRGRLWSLDVNQVRAGHFDSDAVEYELILERPELSDFSDGGKKVASALDELANQADEKHLGFRQFANVTDILNHLEKREAA